MRLFLCLPALLPLFLSPVSAANSFAGTNNYYIWALPDADRVAILDGMQAAGMKVLRTWVTGVAAGQKSTDAPAVPDLEANGLGNYDDTVLDMIDQLMVDAHARGIKLLIGQRPLPAAAPLTSSPGRHARQCVLSVPRIHARPAHRPPENALQAGDIYGSTFGDEGFYTNPTAINAFNQRITHILNVHKNALLGNQPWSDLSAYIFGLEPENEPMIFDQSFYLIRNNVGDRNQLIFTGGGSAGASVQPIFFSSSCPAIDVVAIHDYIDGYDAYMPAALSQALAAGKKLLVEEWGSLAQKIAAYKVPWLYWELISNADPHEGEDYEIQVGGTDWSTIEAAAQSAGALTDAPFDFSASLAL
ncbi:glycoside hydrolase [Mycena pura]|uniref:Glycoside hydrolase n=1 Tax=Mycena pura TaxID=153505 RepID=A0AAD6UTR5_9AGAR|nr:glycoside hydrolase [Mycena pura]